MPLLSRRWHRKAQLDDALERYAVPLSDSASSVFFRLREIIVTGRFQFLLSDTSPTIFHRYKYESTVYRICALLGWIWALKKESSILIETSNSARSIHRCVESIVKSFADGPHVEMDRILRLASLWGLAVDRSDSRFERTSISLNSLFHDLRYTKKNPLGDAIRGMTPNARRSAVRMVARHMSEAFKLPDIADELLASTQDEAVSILSPRQAWIFRDWQDAIGRQMMRSANLGPGARMFDLIGYDEFLESYHAGNPWFRKIDDFLVDLDPSNTDANEYRVQQVRNVFGAIAELIVVLGSLKLRRSVISTETVGLASRYSKRV